MSNMNYISFIVDGQKLSCNQRYYSSTGTINTLSCSFTFKTNDSENTSEWNLPYLWTQFHDENGNTYVKPVNDNVCAIPSDCLKQPEFKMTLFATDTEDYMVCTKRYTTNEVTFRFNGDANLDYDGGVSPDDPMPSNWQILIDRVAEYENRVDGLVQGMTEMGNRVDELGVNLANESTTRDNEDTRLEGLIGDRYTKTETDSLLSNESTARATADANLQSSINGEKTARENADADLRLLINDETNERISGIKALQQSVNSLDDRESSHYNDCTSKISNLDGRVAANESDIATLNVLTESIKGTGAGFHSSIYRGKYLGDTYTDEQKAAIANGSFDDLFVGDYWTINGVNWRIADFDYYYNIGDTNFTKHHVVIVPDKSLYNAQMNSENITTGAYTGSEMYTANLDDARTMFDNAFGESFIPTHRGFYANATSGSNPSGWAWRDMRVELMSEEQVYGHSVWGVASHNGFDVGTQKTQFKLFMLDQTKINIRQWYWLTNVCSSNSFSYVTYYGLANLLSASNSNGVRPFACLVGA